MSQNTSLAVVNVSEEEPNLEVPEQLIVEYKKLNEKVDQVLQKISRKRTASK